VQREQTAGVDTVYVMQFLRTFRPIHSAMQMIEIDQRSYNSDQNTTVF